MFRSKRGSGFEPCQVAADQPTFLHSEEGTFELGRPTWPNGCVARRSNDGQVGTTFSMYERQSRHQVGFWGVTWREGR
jgi:hypothetical protein